MGDEQQDAQGVHSCTGRAFLRRRGVIRQWGGDWRGGCFDGEGYPRVFRRDKLFAGWPISALREQFNPTYTKYVTPINIARMEEDRAATNLGPTAEDNFNSEVPAAPKQPKKRFVGRKTAERAAGKTDPNANIEDSGAIQGMFCREFISSAVY